MEKYKLLRPIKKKLDCFTIVIVADENDGDYITTVETYNKNEFDEKYAAQITKLLKEFSGHYGLTRAESNSGYKYGFDLNLPRISVEKYATP